MNIKKLKDIIRERLKLMLFKEENGINDEEPKDDEKDKVNPPEPDKPGADTPDAEPTPPDETPPPPKPGEKPGEVLPPADLTPQEPEPKSLVPPDYPAKDSEKIYVPGEPLPNEPDHTDTGGDVVPAKDIPIPEPTSGSDYQTNPDVDVPSNAPELAKTISRNEAKQIIKGSKGKIMTAVFTKRTTGEERVMNFRLGVKKYLKGGSLPFDPEEKGLIPVFDLDPKVRDYRMIPVDSIKFLKVGGELYKVI